MKIKNLVYIGLIMLGLSSCVDDKYNMENLDSTMELDTDLVGPLAYSKLNIVDVLNTDSLGDFEIKINGDNQKIRLPNNLIRWNRNNEIVIKAGVNLMQTAYIDYDDFEFMNVSIQVF